MARDDQSLNPIGFDIDTESSGGVHLTDSIGKAGLVARIF
jgi:hypothetical protein